MVVTAACSSSGKGQTAPTNAPTTTSASSDAGSSSVAGGTTSPSGALTGTWSGPWQRTSPPPGGGTNALTLQQRGSELTGKLVAVGSACLTTEQITGTVRGTAVDFHVVGGSATAKYTGSVSGNSMSGTATVTCAAGTGTAKWQLTKG